MAQKKKSKTPAKKTTKAAGKRKTRTAAKKAIKRPAKKKSITATRKKTKSTATRKVKTPVKKAKRPVAKKRITDKEEINSVPNEVPIPEVNKTGRGRPIVDDRDSNPSRLKLKNTKYWNINLKTGSTLS